MAHKKIETPERMWELFCEYRTWVKANPILVQDYVGKDGKEVDRKRERPLTLNGFESWLYEKKVIADIAGYFANEEKRYGDYINVCSMIKKIIRTDQIEGGMCNIYNPNITQRLNGLTEKTENINHNIEVKAEFGTIKPQE